MKKHWLTIVFILFACMSHAQYILQQYINIGQNPGGLNQDMEYPVGGGVPAGWTTVLGPGNTSPVWSPVQSFQMPFLFDGVPVSSYIVSSSGVLSFSTGTTLPAPSFTNVALPVAGIPDNSVCVWGVEGTGSNDYILTKTFGVAPNRQYWVWFNSYSGDISWQYWAVVLEETTNKIYIVDMRSSSTGTALTVGIQISGTMATSLPSSPSTNTYSTSDASPADNTYYEFTPGTIYQYDAKVNAFNLSSPLGLNTAPFTISGQFTNLGTEIINSAVLNYSVNGGPAFSQTITGMSLSQNTSYNFSHDSLWTPPSTGTYTLKIWLSELNGMADENTANDTLVRSIIVYSQYIQRHVLHEAFTSSTCSPCATGNSNLSNILSANPGIFTCLKYPTYWPGNGDPYYTQEVPARISFYGANYVPQLIADGHPGINTASYSQAILDSYVNIPTLIGLSASCEIDGKTVNIHAEVNPIADYASTSLKLYAAIYEDTSYNNEAGSGETVFTYYMKKMIPNVYGTYVPQILADSILSFDYSYTFQGNYRLPNGASDAINPLIEHSVEQFSDLGVVLWLQDTITKEVHQSCFADVTVLPLRDIKVSALVSPVSGALPGNIGIVQVKVNNMGNGTLSNIPVYCWINGSEATSGIISQDILPYDSMVFTFPDTLSFTVPGLYDFMVFSMLPADIDNTNDTLVQELEFYEPLDSLYESFEEAFPPEWWTILKPDGGTGWNQQTVGTTPIPGWNGGFVTADPSGNGGTKMAYCTWNTGGAVSNNQWLITPKIHISEFSYLSFWVRKYSSNYADTMDIRISTSRPVTEDFSTLLSCIGWGVTDSGWVYRNFDLTAFEGQDIYIAFVEHIMDNTLDGDAIFIDQVRVGIQIPPVITRLDSLYGCPGEILVPVRVDYLLDVSSISLTLDYDPAHLTYLGYQNLLPDLNEGVPLIYNANDHVSLAWYGLTPLQVYHDTLVVFRFNANSGSSLLSWDLATPGNCYYTNLASDPLPATFTDGEIVIGTCSHVMGHLNYFNNTNTPVTNTPVFLKQNTDTLAISTTDITGSYHFQGLSTSGNVNIAVNCTKPWGGGNAVDALNVMKHFVGMIQLTGLKLKVSDVDGSGNPNAVDALTIMKRFVGMQNYFVPGDWAFENPLISIPYNDTAFQDLKGLCYGDVDGSYLLALREEPSCYFQSQGIMEPLPDGTVEVPVSWGRNLTPASISLIIKLPEGFVVREVMSAIPGTFIYNTLNDELRIAWYNLDLPLQFAGNEIFVIKGSYKGDRGDMKIMPGSVITDLEENVFADLALLAPEIRSCRQGHFLEENYPNPFSDQTIIPFHLSTTSETVLTIRTLTGTTLWRSGKMIYPEGDHEWILWNQDWSPGAYLYTLEAMDKDHYWKSTRVMLLTK